MTEPTTPTGKRLVRWGVTNDGEHITTLPSIASILAIEHEAAQQACPDPADHALAAAVRRGGLVEAAQAYIDWRDERLAAWHAVAECGHSDPFCPEMEVVRADPLNHDVELDDAIRAGLAAITAALEDKP